MAIIFCLWLVRLTKKLYSSPYFVPLWPGLNEVRNLPYTQVINKIWSREEFKVADFIYTDNVFLKTKFFYNKGQF